MDPIPDLPPEIHTYIFSKLPINQLSIVMRVCSYWNTLVNTPLFWKLKAEELARRDLNYRKRFYHFDPLSSVDWKEEVREYGSIGNQVRTLFHLAVLIGQAGDLIRHNQEFCYQFQSSLKEKMYRQMLEIDQKLEKLLNRPFLSDPVDLRYLFGEIDLTVVKDSVVVFKAKGRNGLVDIALLFPKNGNHVGLYCADSRRVCIQVLRHEKNHRLNPGALRILQKIKAGKKFYVHNKGYLTPLKVF